LQIKNRESGGKVHTLRGAGAGCKVQNPLMQDTA